MDVSAFWCHQIPLVTLSLQKPLMDETNPAYSSPVTFEIDASTYERLLGQSARLGARSVSKLVRTALEHFDYEQFRQQSFVRKQLSVRIPPQLKAELVATARRTGASQAVILRAALEQLSAEALTAAASDQPNDTTMAKKPTTKKTAVKAAAKKAVKKATVKKAPVKKAAAKKAAVKKAAVKKVAVKKAPVKKAVVKKAAKKAVAKKAVAKKAATKTAAKKAPVKKAAKKAVAKKAVAKKATKKAAK